MQVMALETEEMDGNKPARGIFSPQPVSKKLQPELQRDSISQVKAFMQSKQGKQRHTAKPKKMLEGDDAIAEGTA